MQITDFFKNKKWKSWDKSQWTIVILTGVLLMILAIPTEGKKEEKKQEETINKQVETTGITEDMYVLELEKRLESVLSKIEGAGAVDVMITLSDFGESVIEKEKTVESSKLQETDSAGGSRLEESISNEESAVYTEETEGKVPFVGKKNTPKIAGILVVAQGGENTSVKQNISDAVMALFQIDVNRIKVVKMNIQEEGY